VRDVRIKSACPTVRVVATMRTFLPVGENLKHVKVQTQRRSQNEKL
jgi:hypothetical protein